MEGYATTFNDPYTLYEYDGIKYNEVIDARALDGADLSDVIMLYNHEGRVMARKKNGSLIVEPTERGLFVAADLSLTELGRGLYADIRSGLIDQMSWAFTVANDKIERGQNTITRTITQIDKIYDVSAVSIPANPQTSINARSWVDGAIQTANAERRARELLMLKLKLEGF